MWDVASGAKLRRLKGPTGPFVEVLGHGSRLIIANAYEDRLELWDFKRNKMLATAESPDRPVYALALAPNGTTLTLGHSFGTITLHEIKTLFPGQF